MPDDILPNKKPAPLTPETRRQQQLALMRVALAKPVLPEKSKSDAPLLSPPAGASGVRRLGKLPYDMTIEAFFTARQALYPTTQNQQNAHPKPYVKLFERKHIHTIGELAGKRKKDIPLIGSGEYANNPDYRNLKVAQWQWLFKSFADNDIPPSFFGLHADMDAIAKVKFPSHFRALAKKGEIVPPRGR